VKEWTITTRLSEHGMWLGRAACKGRKWGICTGSKNRFDVITGLIRMVDQSSAGHSVSIALADFPVSATASK
jgi:hypothetical protein